MLSPLSLSLSVASRLHSMTHEFYTIIRPALLDGFCHFDWQQGSLHLSEKKKRHPVALNVTSADHHFNTPMLHAWGVGIDL